MSINDYVIEFNANIDQLLSELEIISEQLHKDNLISTEPINHLSYYKNLCKTSRVLNKDIIIESMSGYILQNNEFVNQINQKNCLFFETYDFSKETNKTNILELINCIIKVFNVLSSENQDIIFEYLQVLCGISYEYIKLKFK